MSGGDEELPDRPIHALAEREHVDLVRHWLNKYPEPTAGWDEDPDPPVGN